MAKLLFFTGKGGVGKSTTSSLFAFHLAKAGYSVLLNSLDPAHNLHDVFETSIGSKTKKLMDNLYAQETDLEAWVKKYLKQTEADFKQIYKYQEAFNLHKYFKTLKYSPGLEEYAALLALEDTVSRHADKDFIVFDTPPTALTLKFLALPDVSLIWLNELSKFRQMILSKKEIVTKIRTGFKQNMEETDPVLAKVGAMKDQYSQLSALLKKPAQTTIFNVLNPTVLSLEESRDIDSELTRLGFKIPWFILNKCNASEEAFVTKTRKTFPKSQVLTQQSHPEELTGIKRLEQQQLPLDLTKLTAS